MVSTPTAAPVRSVPEPEIALGTTSFSLSASSGRPGRCQTSMRYDVEPRGPDQATICTPRYETFWHAAAAALMSRSPRRTWALPDGTTICGRGPAGPRVAAGGSVAPVPDPARLSATTSSAARAPSTALVTAMTGRHRLQYSQSM